MNKHVKLCLEQKPASIKIGRECVVFIAEGGGFNIIRLNLKRVKTIRFNWPEGSFRTRYATNNTITF